MLTPIGIIEQGDSKHKDCWWIMPDGSKVSGCPDYLLKEIQAVYLKKEARGLLKACKCTAQYCFSVAMNNLVKTLLYGLKAIQKLIGWPIR